MDRKLVFESLPTAMREAERLARAEVDAAHSPISFVEILQHAAQSIDYSVLGFPEAKSAFFQNTAGALAFRVFSWRGRMSHDLSAPIPGAPALDGTASVDVAMAALDESVVRFERAGDALQPHFAYGALDAAQYELAHAMHLANHFSVVDA